MSIYKRLIAECIEIPLVSFTNRFSEFGRNHITPRSSRGWLDLRLDRVTTKDAKVRIIFFDPFHDAVEIVLIRLFFDEIVDSIQHFFWIMGKVFKLDKVNLVLQTFLKDVQSALKCQPDGLSIEPMVEALLDGHIGDLDRIVDALWIVPSRFVALMS